MRLTLLAAALGLLAPALAAAQEKPTPAPGEERPPVQVGGVFPQIAVVAGPRERCEAGIGALLPWADRLWFVGYVAHIRGEGTGLYWVGERMQMRRHPAGVVGTFANRYVHNPTDQAVIGPHVIDARGNVRTIEALKGHRLTATVDHLADPQRQAYFLTMEGLFFEVDMRTLEARRLFDLVKELGITFKEGREHFKSAYAARGRVVVANNSYYEADYLGEQAAGRLAEWDGKSWTVIERKPFVEVSGKNWSGPSYGSPILAVGWDRDSVILKLLAKGRWLTYRLPKSTQTFDHAWNTEWMRIRDAQTERFLMDAHGMFYEVPAQIFDGRLLPIRPISTHLRIVPDFCYWRGLFVLAGDQTDRSWGQPQSGLWFGQVDDLWRMGKPAGWGGVWRKHEAKAGEASDPFLMTGFDRKVAHLANDSAAEAEVRLEVDFLGDGTWRTYEVIRIPAQGYLHHEFPAGFSAHWVRATSTRDATLTVYFTYS